MRTLTKPDDVAGDVFTTCISRVRNPKLRRSLRGIERAIADAATAYDEAASNSELHTFPMSGDIADVTRKQMMAVYTYRMVSEDQPGRPIYDKLLNAPRNKICPLCGVVTVQTLDHHLPKSGYTNVAVTPINLIPSCYWCQTSKKQHRPTTAREQTFHPYYDDFTNENWLRATVNEEAPASFFFFADPPGTWDGDRQARVLQHMESFNLPELFASNAGNHLVSMRLRLSKLFAAGGSAEVRRDLLEHADSHRAAFRNSWEAAMYSAAASSDWFCETGFVLE